LRKGAVALNWFFHPFRDGKKVDALHKVNEFYEKTKGRETKERDQDDKL
jgi:hypothetical protein